MEPTIIPPAAVLLGLAAGGIAKGIVDVLRTNTTPGKVPPIVWPILAWIATTAIVGLLMMSQNATWNQQTVSLVLLAGVLGAVEAVSLTEIHNKSANARAAAAPEADALPWPPPLMERMRTALRRTSAERSPQAVPRNEA
jgi:hypothetical protein